MLAKQSSYLHLLIYSHLWIYRIPFPIHINSLDSKLHQTKYCKVTYLRRSLIFVESDVWAYPRIQIPFQQEKVIAIKKTTKSGRPPRTTTLQLSTNILLGFFWGVVVVNSDQTMKFRSTVKGEFTENEARG